MCVCVVGFLFFFFYLKWTLAVVVLHFLVGSADQQHSGTVILEETDRKY